MMIDFAARVKVAQSLDEPARCSMGACMCIYVAGCAFNDSSFSYLLINNGICML